MKGGKERERHAANYATEWDRTWDATAAAQSRAYPGPFSLRAPPAQFSHFVYFVLILCFFELDFFQLHHSDVIRGILCLFVIILLLKGNFPWEIHSAHYTVKPVKNILYKIDSSPAFLEIILRLSSTKVPLSDF